MIKQWRNDNLGIIYFYIPNSKKNEILTSDGVLLSYDEFKSMTAEEYQSKKNTSGGYDYQLSRQSERLVKKVANLSPINTNKVSPNGVNKSSTDFSRSSNQIKTEYNTPNIEKTKVSKEIVDKKEVVKEIKTNENKIESASASTPNENITNKKENEKFNWFDFAYPKLTLIIVIICSCLSIFFTGTYMQRLQTIYVAYAISSAILIYGIIGMQIARRSWGEKKYIQAFMFGITAISVLIFSMFSAVDVNYAKFKESHFEIEETYNVNDGKKISYELMKDELSENKKQIDLLNEDIKFQQTQWVLAWDNEKKQNILLEGRISSTAQQKITDDNIRIDKLNKRNEEINQKLREYAESGISVEKTESKTERAKSLTDLIGALFGISGNVVQLIILLIPSIFCDLINILGTTIYCQKFENK